MVKVKNTEHVFIRGNDNLDKLNHISKNLYNKSNRIIKQKFFHNYECIGYHYLDKIINDQDNYKKIFFQNTKKYNHENKEKDHRYKFNKFLIKFYTVNEICKIVKGYSNNFKQNLNTDKRNNQIIMQIEFGNIAKKITYKEWNRIKIEVQEEGNTRKCSFFYDEKIKHFINYFGKGINLSVEYNIIRKSVTKIIKRMNAYGMKWCITQSMVIKNV
ncbi:MAG: hypothetical protein QW380_01590 [Thermoplasmata archaeon]